MSWEEPRRRRALTPLSGELRAEAPRTEPFAGGPGLRARIGAWRRRRRPPQTLRGALALGLVRLVVALAAGAGIAYATAAILDRTLAVGFYVAGALLLAVAFMSSAADVTTPFYWGTGERALRVNRSFSYALVGVMLVGIGLLVEASG